MTNERLGLSAPNGNDIDFARFEDRFSSWTCVHSCLTCVRVCTECSVGKTLVVEGFRVRSFSSRVLAVRNMGRKEESANCVLRELVLSKSRICGELGTFLRRGWQRRSTKVCREHRGPLPSDSCLRVHTGPVCNVSRCLKEW